MLNNNNRSAKFLPTCVRTVVGLSSAASVMVMASAAFGQSEQKMQCKIVVEEAGNTGSFYVSEILPESEELRRAFYDAFIKYRTTYGVPSCEAPMDPKYSVLGMTYNGSNGRFMTVRAATDLVPNWKKTVAGQPSKGTPGKTDALIVKTPDAPAVKPTIAAPKPVNKAKPAVAAKPAPKKSTGCKSGDSARGKVCGAVAR